MKHLKDTTKTLLNTKPANNTDLSRTLADKAQKITIAAYMITGLLPETDTMRDLIRRSASQTLASLLQHAKSGQNTMSLIQAEQHLYDMISYVQVVYQTGLLSEMNYQILSTVATNLQSSIRDHITLLGDSVSVAKNEQVSLDKLFSGLSVESIAPAMLQTDTETNTSTELQVNKHINLEPKTHTDLVKTNNLKSESVLGKKSLEPKTETSAQVRDMLKTDDKKQTGISAKSKRHENILDILKQKRKASINEICVLFKDCSSKTIQRDLNELIEIGKVMKRGDRRWATYDLK